MAYLERKAKPRSFWEVRGEWHRTAHEWSINCPFCESVRGKPDKGRRLYWNPVKRVGSCQKCKTVIVDDTVPTVTQLYESHIALEERKKPKEQKYNLSWTQPAHEVGWALEYLTQKRGFDLDTIARWEMRAAEFPKRMIVLPDVVDGQYTNFFQARYLEADKIKYVSPSKADKPVYGLRLCQPNDVGVFVGEGCFSAISTHGVPGWGSVATYGKSATYRQLRAIADLPVEHICIVYDGGEIEALMNSAESLLPAGKQVSIAVLPMGQDPNSMGFDRWLRHTRKHMLPVNNSTRSILVGLKDMDQRSWDRMLHLARSHSLSIL